MMEKAISERGGGGGVEKKKKEKKRSGKKLEKKEAKRVEQIVNVTEINPKVILQHYSLTNF